MATAARVKVELTSEVRQAINALADAKVQTLLLAEKGEPTGDPNPIFDNLRAEVARNRLADDLLADSQDPSLTWWQRGRLRREARDLRGGVL